MLITHRNTIGGAADPRRFVISLFYASMPCGLHNKRVKLFSPSNQPATVGAMITPILGGTSTVCDFYSFTHILLIITITHFSTDGNVKVIKQLFSFLMLVSFFTLNI
jgi:hypothetical protein